MQIVTSIRGPCQQIMTPQMQKQLHICHQEDPHLEVPQIHHLIPSILLMMSPSSNTRTEGRELNWTQEDDAPSKSLETYEEFKKCKRGRPRCPAKAPHRDFTRPTSIAQHNVRRDRIDEECERLGIYYKKWVPLNPDQTSHYSVRDYNDDTKVPEEQEVGEWCIMCPKNRFMWNHLLTRKHYLSVHQKKLLVIGDYKLWRCKCSEVHSHGSDNSARNTHYHCHLCYHPFKTKDLLGTHLVTQHLEIETGQVRHLAR